MRHLTRGRTRGASCAKIRETTPSARNSEFKGAKVRRGCTFKVDEMIAGIGEKRFGWGEW